HSCRFDPAAKQRLGRERLGRLGGEDGQDRRRRRTFTLLLCGRQCQQTVIRLYGKFALRKPVYDVFIDLAGFCHAAGAFLFPCLEVKILGRVRSGLAGMKWRRQSEQCDNDDKEFCKVHFILSSSDWLVSTPPGRSSDRSIAPRISTAPSQATGE